MAALLIILTGRFPPLIMGLCLLPIPACQGRSKCNMQETRLGELVTENGSYELHGYDDKDENH